MSDTLRQERVLRDAAAEAAFDLGEDAAEHDQAVATAASHAAIDTAVDRDRPRVADEQAADALADEDVAEDEESEDAADAGPPTGKTIILGGGAHVVAAGDTLWKISKYEYGEGKHWRKIKQANRDKLRRGLNPDTILRIPEMEVDTLHAFKGFRRQPDRLRDIVVLMPREDYEGFMAGLTEEQIDRNAELLQLLEINRSTRMTIKELAAEQRRFMREQAEAKGADVEDVAENVVTTQGYGGAEAMEWKRTPASEKRRWKQRFKAAVKKIKDTAPPDVQEIIETAERKGGGFQWSPREVEENGAFAYTMDDWSLYCGTEWVKAAESDPESVYGNISHEMGGHNYYGDSFGYTIIEGALTSREERAAEKSGNSLYSAYGYMETEIFAELYEYPYNLSTDRDYPSDTAFDTNKEGEPTSASGRDPDGDVYGLLRRMREQFAPTVVHGLVQGLLRRVQLDPRIIPEAKERFEKAVRDVFTGS